MRSLISAPAVVISLLAARALVCAAADNAQTKGVSISEQPGRLVITIDGQPFTEYVTTNASRPYCYPILGPGQLSMTRNWPMKEVPGEEHDHPHHKGLWYAHGAVNGVDFWSEGKDAGRVAHQRFTAIKSGEVGTIQAEDKWFTKDGKLMCTDERILHFRKAGKNSSGRIIDFEVRIKASEGALTFGDTKEGTMAIRLAETMRVKGGLNKGHIVNNRGERDGATWGKQAEWCDYYGPVDGKIVGVAMFDHPSNPRHPTWWHVRDYGLFAANPFGKHDFESLPNKQAGDLKVPAGSTITFKYRFYFHEGDEVQGKVADVWKEFRR